MPTQQQMVEHGLTHLPFWPWCPDCIKGQAQAVSYRRGKSGEISGSLRSRTTMDSQLLTKQEGMRDEKKENPKIFVEKAERTKKRLAHAGE